MTPNPYRDKNFKFANQAEKILRDAGLETRICLAFDVDKSFELPEDVALHDLSKELRLVKSLDGLGGYRYSVPHKHEGDRFDARFRVIFRECVTSIDCAQNLIVIKTMPSLGAAAGANIDALHMPSVVGTLSGDDTTLVIMRDNESAMDFCDEIHRMLD